MVNAECAERINSVFPHYLGFRANDVAMVSVLLWFPPSLIS
jgi:hypothetical protein